MEFTELGATGLRVSVAGLGCGGPSRLGQTYGRTEEQSADVVRAALDAGINFLDTSEMYGTEEIVGRAIAGRRDEVVLCTKGYWRDGDQGIVGPEHLRNKLGASLRRLGTDHVDVYLIHALTIDGYDEVTRELVPVLEALRDEGKIRHIGVSEMFGADTGHQMLVRAMDDDWVEVAMVGYNLLNPSAAERVFPLTRAKGVGTLDMFAVRRALSQPDRLRELIATLIAEGALGEELDPEDPLGFLVHEGGATSVVDAAYRFVRHTDGMDVVLTGTGNIDHLKDNIDSILRPPLPAADRDRLAEAFGSLDSVSAN